MNTQQRRWLLLFLCIYFATITGGFFSLPGLSPLIGVAGLAIAFFYAGMVCLFRRRATYMAMGVAILFAIVFPHADGPLMRYLVAVTLSLNFWVFGEMGITLLTQMNRQQAFFRLAGLFVGLLGLGWVWVSFFGW